MAEPESDQPFSSVVARLLTISGRVQGVNFRASTQHVAERYDVSGWVENRPDGTVEAWVEGSNDDVETVVAWIREGGPPAAEIVEVRARDVRPAGHERFEVHA